VAGPATGPALAALPAGSTTVGVRWRPGAGAPALGVPLDALRDATVPLAELWRGDLPARLTERLATAAGPAERRALLEQTVAARVAAAGPADPLVAQACRALAASAAGDRAPGVRALADALGVSERQLLRRFRAAVGYGPKTLVRVLRFQRFLDAAWGRGEAESAPAADLALLAAQAGFADQAHLTRECGRLAGATPAELLAAA
jgi:AraC-like DNA-binding protein